MYPLVRRLLTDQKISDPHVRSEDFRNLLQFLYCAEANLSESTVLPLLHLASQYIVGDLFCLCVEYFLKILSPSNCFLSWNHSLALRQEGLAEKCRLVVVDKTEEALAACPVLHPITAETMLLFVKQEVLAISELKIFQFVMKWIQAQRPRPLVPQEVEAIVQCIRFPLISALELKNVVKKFTTEPGQPISLPNNFVPFGLYCEAMEFHACPEGSDPSQIKFKQRKRIFEVVSPVIECSKENKVVR